jgi:CHAT domain-containing protein/Tfp pilus assembly protein PilF
MKRIAKTIASVLLVGISVCLGISDIAQAKDLQNYYQEGVQAYRAASYREAIRAWKGGLNLSEQQGHEKAQGIFLGNIGVVYTELGQYEKALSYYQKALAIHRKLGDVKGEGNNLTNIGNVNKILGQYENALSYYQKAIAIDRKLGDVKGEGGDLTNIGEAHRNLGQYEKALSFFQKALAIHRKIGDVKGEGAVLTNIGLVYQNLGQYDKALSYFQKALAIEKKIGDVKGEGGDLTNIGALYRILGRYEKALSYYQKALAIHRKIGDVRREGGDLGSIGNVYNSMGRYEKAIPYYQKALAIHAKIGDVKGVGTGLTNIGALFGNLGQYEKAIPYFQKALTIDRKIGYVRGEGSDLNNIGYAMLSTGKPAQAEKHLESAIDAWESIRKQVKTGKERTGFQSTLPDVYGNLAAARLAQDDQSGAFEAIERGRAKSFLDLLGTRGAGARRSKKKTEQIAKAERQLVDLREKSLKFASAPVGAKTRSVLRKALDQKISNLDKQRLELIDQLRRNDPELGSLVVVDPPTLKEIQNLLPSGTALVEYFHPGKHIVSGKEKNQLWIFVVDARGLHFKNVDVPKSDLEKALEKYAKLVADGSSDPKAVVSAGAKLYKWLIEPIEPISQLTDSETLIIVPWGPMFKIPFAALKSKGGKPLCAGQNIVMAPSAGAYRYLVKKRSSGRKNIVAIGNPKTALTPLPGAEKEAREIAGLFGKSAIYTRSKATEGLIKKDYAKLGRPDVVHLACHGIFNERAPQLSHLALTPDQKNDGKLEMHELFDLDWRGVSLVTMSACSSGKGKLGVGDDLVGLTRGFMFAGAPSILCSLWDVDDEATRALMVSFYKNYLSGMSKPESLRKAQIAMQKSKKWSHPYYWGAFVLFGDWE